MRVGLAGATITPDRPVRMTGYISRTEPSEGAYADLEAAVALFEEGGKRVGIIALDLVGVDEYLLEPIRAKAESVGIPPESMLVNCSHTHCAPACRVVRGSCRVFDYEYLDGLASTVGRLLEEAVVDLQEATLDYRVGTCILGINRRRARDGKAVGMLPAPGKPVDTDVPVLRVLTPDGDVRGALFSYACHPTTMGGQLIGPDYPGAARNLLREALPGCLPVFLQGCGGDVKPRNITGDGRFASGPVEVVQDIGRELGRGVLAALCAEPQQVSGDMSSASAVAKLPTVGTPTPEQLAELDAGNQWERTWAAAARETIAEKGGLAETLPVEVQALRLGELTIIGLSGEASCEIGLELKARLPERSLMTLGYSNLLRCYVASRGAHAEGGYEVRDSFLYSWNPEPRPLGLKPESADVLVDAALETIGSA